MPLAPAPAVEARVAAEAAAMPLQRFEVKSFTAPRSVRAGATVRCAAVSPTGAATARARAG